MDAVTTELLAVLGSHVAEIIKKDGIRKEGWGSTCNYSPGQYKWTIEEQSEIFSMIDGGKIGVRLNENYLMIPFKSSSGVYGFGPADEIDKTRVACDICPVSYTHLKKKVNKYCQKSCYQSNGRKLEWMKLLCNYPPKRMSYSPKKSNNKH